MSKAFDAAKRKGANARRAGMDETANPYVDLRTGKGAITFARAFRRAWSEGWREADREAPAS